MARGAMSEKCTQKERGAPPPRVLSLKPQVFVLCSRLGHHSGRTVLCYLCAALIKEFGKTTSGEQQQPTYL